jgi:hypothetical protein
MMINAHEGREQSQVCGQNAGPLDETMISLLVSKVKPSHLADFAALCAAVLWWKVLNPIYKSCKTSTNLASACQARHALVGVGAV